jgi:hypothetical protein
LEELQPRRSTRFGSGKLALEWLQNTYGVANMEFIQMVQKYMEYLSTTKTADQNLYDFAKSLKSKLNALHDSKWSMTDLYNVLILAHAIYTLLND